MCSGAAMQRNGSIGSARTRTGWSQGPSVSAMRIATAIEPSANAGPRSITRRLVLSPARDRLMIPAMLKKLLMVLVNTDPRNREALGSPFFQAAVAAAMDFEVEVVCTGSAGRLMKRGVADALIVKPGAAKSVYDFIKDAH